MRDLAIVILIFAGAIVAGATITPLMSIVFVLVARILLSVWEDTARSYRAAQQAHQEKPKRKHILTGDGESLEVVAADDSEDPLERAL